MRPVRDVMYQLVEEYIESGQPVGSKSIVEKFGLDCSSATVRNELGALEENGYETVSALDGKEGFEKAKRSGLVKMSDFVMSGVWKGFTPPPLPPKE